MSKGVLICVFCLICAEGCADMTAAQCWVTDAQGMQVISTKPLHPGKHSSHYRIAPDLFLKFRYDAFTSAVAVMSVESPHYPWGISEKTLDSTVVRMSGAPLKGESTIRTPALTIMCQELQRD
jgi:hypothetical protein